jgi:hypothetical protein
MTRRRRRATLWVLRPMALNPATPRLVLAVIPLTTARFGMNGSPSAPDGGLSSAPDGLLLPIGLALAGVLLLVVIARWRLKAGQPSEAAESDAGVSGDPDAASASDRNLPRWLDPSVVAARFRTDPTPAARAAAAVAIAPSRAPVVFSDPIDELAERMRVRYDGVPLLDRPDDVLGRTVGELDGGDEVEVLERGEIWARVKTPKSAAGWLPSMTLAPVATAAEEADLDAREPIKPEPPMPADDSPTLEALLEIIAAQRLARQEVAIGPDREAPVTVNDAPLAPKRPRSRTPRTDRPAAQRLARHEPASALEPEPAAQLDLAPAAPKRPRSRQPGAGRPAARPH